MADFNFTQGELQVAMILTLEAFSGMGGERPIHLDDDPYTWAWPETLQPWGYTKHQIAGYWSSLLDKGFMYIADESKDRGIEYAITDEGYRYIDTVWDDNQHLLVKGAK
jgi:hypothetical protein